MVDDCPCLLSEEIFSLIDDLGLVPLSECSLPNEFGYESLSPDEFSLVCYDLKREYDLDRCKKFSLRKRVHSSNNNYPRFEAF